MEEILGVDPSHHSDDEAKPAAAEKPASPSAAAQRPLIEGYPAVGDCARAEAVAAAAPKPAPPAPPRRRLRPNRPSATTRTTFDRCWRARCGDAGGGHQAGATEADVFELTDDDALPDPAPPAASVNKIERRTTSNSAKLSVTSPSRPRPPFESAAPARPILSHSPVSAVGQSAYIRWQYRAEQQCTDAGGSGQKCCGPC